MTKKTWLVVIVLLGALAVLGGGFLYTHTGGGSGYGVEYHDNGGY